MNRWLMWTLLFAMSALPALADGRHGRGRWKHHRGHAAYYAARPVFLAPPVYATPGFGWCDPDIAYLRGYYGPRHYHAWPVDYSLAPGRPLPPGLVRMVRPFPVHVERRLAPLPRGYSRGFVGG